MSTIDPKEQPEKWLEEKAHEGSDKVRSCCDDLKQAAMENPLAAVGVAFGVGYVARSLPLFRTAIFGVRSSLSLLPYGLALVGAARAYELYREKNGESGS